MDGWIVLSKRSDLVNGTWTEGISRMRNVAG